MNLASVSISMSRIFHHKEQQYYGDSVTGFGILPSAYLKGSKEREELQAALEKHGNKIEDIPIVVGSEEIRTDKPRYQVKYLA